MPRRPGSAPSLAAPPLPTIHLARDHTTPEVARQVRDGAWVRVRPAAYIATEPGQDPNARRQTVALAQIVALREQLSTDYTLSHESAALLWGLPLLRTPTRTHIIQGWQPKSTHHDLVRHVHRLAEEHQVVHRGHPVTTLERTVVDCAMALGAHAGLVLADAALRAGADRGRCKEILTGMAGRHGAPVARAVLDLADDGAESPGESSARFVLLRAGLPVPETQVRVDTHLGTFWADLGWRSWRLLAEYDGRAKYEASGSASEAVVHEKRRQEAVEEADWRMLRVTKEDIRRPDTLLRRVVRMAPAGSVDVLRPRAVLNTPPPRR